MQMQYEAVEKFEEVARTIKDAELIHDEEEKRIAIRVSNQVPLEVDNLIRDDEAFIAPKSARKRYVEVYTRYK